jgi:hypothetical protein
MKIIKINKIKIQKRERDKKNKTEGRVAMSAPYMMVERNVRDISSR